MKTCTQCGIKRDDSEFYLKRKGDFERRSSCRFCVIRYSENYQKTDRGKEAAKKYRNSIKYKKTELKYRKSEKNKKRMFVYNHSDAGKNSLFKSKFGITLDDYKRMQKEQKGLCAICGNPETIPNPHDKNKVCLLVVDHDHNTGKVRQLLCRRCNSAISYFTENIKYLANAISYLEKHKNKIEIQEEAG